VGRRASRAGASTALAPAPAAPSGTVRILHERDLRERKLMTSDRKLRAFRKGSKLRIYAKERTLGAAACPSARIVRIFHKWNLRERDPERATSARYRAVEPSSGTNVIPRRARPGLAGLRPHSFHMQSKSLKRTCSWIEIRFARNKKGWNCR